MAVERFRFVQLSRSKAFPAGLVTPATGGLESHPVNTIHRYTVFPVNSWLLTMEMSICGSNGISELADPGPSTSCDKALSCPDTRTHQHTNSCHSTCGSMQPTQKFLVQHHFSCIPITQLQWSLLFFSDFTWWRYYILSCFSEIDGTKLEKNPCHMKCSSLFMRCDRKTWYSYVLFKITWYSYMIHINLTSILSTYHPSIPPICSRWATASPRCDLQRLGDSPEATSDRPTLPGNLVGSCGESSLWHACRRWFPGKWQWTDVSYPKKNGNHLCQSSSNMRKPAIQPQKNAFIDSFFAFIIIYHWSNIES